MSTDWDDPTASPQDSDAADYVDEGTDTWSSAADRSPATPSELDLEATDADNATTEGNPAASETDHAVTDQDEDDPSAVTDPAEAADSSAQGAASSQEGEGSDPQVLTTRVTEASAGPLTTPPSEADRDLLPGVTDVAAGLGHALGVGSDELGLVEVEVNGLMGVRVRLDPGLVQLSVEMVGHSLAGALEQARSEVVGRLDDHFRRDPRINEWIAEATRRPEGVGAPTEPTEKPRQVTTTSADGLVSIVVDPGGRVSSVVVAEGELDLDRVAEAFVRTAEDALQGVGDTGDGLDVDGRIDRFDRSMAEIAKGLDELDAELSDVLKRWS